MGRHLKITLGLATVFVSASGILYSAAGEYLVAKSVAQDPTIPHVEIHGVTLYAGLRRSRQSRGGGAMKRVVPPRADGVRGS